MTDAYFSYFSRKYTLTFRASHLIGGNRRNVKVCWNVKVCFEEILCYLNQLLKSYIFYYNYQTGLWKHCRLGWMQHLIWVYIRPAKFQKWIGVWLSAEHDRAQRGTDQAKRGSLLGGSGGMPPGKFWKSRCHFLHSEALETLFYTLYLDNLKPRFLLISHEISSFLI